MICPKCINPNSDDAKVCAYCGNPLTNEVPVNTNVSTMEVNNTPQVEKNNEKKKVDFNKILEVVKKNKIILLAIIGVIVLIFIIMGLISLFNPKEKNEYKEQITYAEVFFLENKDNKYALFTDSGKQLTEFIYEDVGEFINGCALVENDKNEKGVINTKGKMTIPFGKYKYLYDEAGLYKATDEEYNEYLLSNTGKVLYDMEDASISTFIGVDSFLIVKTDEEYIVFSYNGKKIHLFKAVEDAKSPSVNEEDGYASVFYNDTTIILESNTGKLVSKISGDVHYCVNNVSEDEKTITLNSCVSWFESQETTTYKVIRNGKVVDYDSSCEKVYLADDYLICKTNETEYFLDKNMKKGLEYKKYGYAYLSDKDHATSGAGIEFFKNGQSVKAVDGVSLSEKGIMKGNYYIVYNPTDKYSFYNVDGTKAIEENFQRVNDFDKNGLAKVSKDGEKYYLINAKGKSISKEYKTINNYDKYYVVKNDELEGLIDKAGKEIISLDYSDVEVRIVRGEPFAIAKKDNGTREVYDLTKKKLIATFDKDITLNDHYIKHNNERAEYYTYSGKKFFEE